MENGISIKGIKIGGGIPVICVPVIERRKLEIVHEIKRLAASDVEMIEWRADWFDDISDVESVLEILEKVREDVEDTILLFTVRSISQGGQGKMDERKLSELLTAVSNQKVADLIDVELFELSEGKKLISELQNDGTKIIASQHDFMQTPKPEKMWDLLKKMKEAGADIVKLATMPEDPQDVLDVLSVTNRFHSTYPETPVITMSMGSMGVISRVSGEIFGSAVTFGSDGEGSAPGQIEIHQLKRILENVHENNK